MKKTKVGIIGCGNMGAAVLKAAVSRHSSIVSYDVDKKRLRDAAKRYKVKVASSSNELARKCDVVILAVKPKDISAVVSQVKGVLNPSKTVISIVAGVETTRLEKAIGKKVAVIRVMPNMPAMVGAGISAICKGRFATNADMAVTKKIFTAIGEVVEVKEGLMDAVTAISGSGPAYFFYLVEVLIEAGIESGLSRAVAQKLAVETAIGSAEVLKETAEHAGILRARVTSKGGTTEAAFDEFFKHDLAGILKKGVNKAIERAKCL